MLIMVEGIGEKDRRKALYLPLPWIAWLAALVLALGALGLALFSQGLLNPWENVFGLASVLAFATIGALIVVRRRDNRIGWLFLIFAILFALQIFSSAYAVYAFRVLRGSLPGATFMAWLQNWLTLPTFSLVSVFLMIYPDGQLLSRRWSIFLGILLIVFSSFALYTAIEDSWIAYLPFWSDQPIPLLNHNPAAVPALVARLEPIKDFFWLFLMIVFVLPIIVPVLRYTKADPVTRLQLRWLMYLSVFFFIALILSVVGSDLEWLVSSYLNVLWMIIALIGFPAAVGVAVLRHNLYDIDLIIGRTLVYGALTATLGLVYFASVTMLQLVLPVRSEFAIVVSTLAVAALFNPLRGQIQNIIDRRFYRRKYDALKTLIAFGAIARDVVDLDDLITEMLQVIDKTVQPEAVSLWLREQ